MHLNRPQICFIFLMDFIYFVVKFDPDVFPANTSAVRLFQSFVFNAGCLYAALEAIESFEANMTGI